MTKTKTKTPAPAMTPQRFHLTEGPKLRDQLAKDYDKAAAAINANERAAVLAAARRAGIQLPWSAKPYNGRYSDGNNQWQVGKITVTIGVDTSRAGIGKGDRPVDRLHRRRKALCANLTTAGANHFAAFVKTKYGKNADVATIKKAHGEWLDLLSACTC